MWGRSPSIFYNVTLIAATVACVACYAAPLLLAAAEHGGGGAPARGSQGVGGASLLSRVAAA